MPYSSRPKYDLLGRRVQQRRPRLNHVNQRRLIAYIRGLEQAGCPRLIMPELILRFRRILEREQAAAAFDAAAAAANARRLLEEGRKRRW